MFPFGFNSLVTCPCLFDSRLNLKLPRRYEMLLVCAAKTAASALRLPRGPAGNAPLLSRGALETTAYAYSLIQSRSNRRKGSFGTSKGVRCVCKVQGVHLVLSWMLHRELVDFVGRCSAARIRRRACRNCAATYEQTSTLFFVSFLSPSDPKTTRRRPRTRRL